MVVAIANYFVNLINEDDTILLGIFDAQFIDLVDINQFLGLLIN